MRYIIKLPFFFRKTCRNNIPSFSDFHFSTSNQEKRFIRRIKDRHVYLNPYTKHPNENQTETGRFSPQVKIFSLTYISFSFYNHSNKVGYLILKPIHNSATCVRIIKSINPLWRKSAGGYPPCDQLFLIFVNHSQTLFQNYISLSLVYRDKIA